MSMSSMGPQNSDVQGLYYSAVQIDYDQIHVDPMERMVPVLGDEPTGPLKEYVDELEEKRVPYKLLPLHVEGKTAEEIKSALVPLKLHYLMQILLVRERTHRRVIDNEEFTSRSNINVGYQYSTPLKSKLLAYWTTKFLEEQEPGQSLGSMPSSTANTPHPSATPRTDTSATASPHARKPAPRRTLREAPHDEEALKRTVANFEKTLNRLLDSTASPKHPHTPERAAATMGPLNLPAVESTPLTANHRTTALAGVHVDAAEDVDEL